MKRPTTLQFILANPVVGLAAIGATGWIAYRWWHGEAADVALILAMVGLVIMGGALDVVSAYQEKQMEWAMLSGQPYRQGFRIPISENAKNILGILIWIGMAYAAFRSRDQPDMKLALWLLVGGTAVGLLAIIVRRARAKRPTKKRASRDVAVAQCLTPPSRSPSIGQTTRELPQSFASLVVGQR